MNKDDVVIHVCCRRNVKKRFHIKFQIDSMTFDSNKLAS